MGCRVSQCDMLRAEGRSGVEQQGESSSKLPCAAFYAFVVVMADESLAGFCALEIEVGSLEEGISKGGGIEGDP